MSYNFSGIDEINLSQATLDSREIDARIEWLEAQAEDSVSEDMQAEPLTDDEQEELTALRKLRDELQGYTSDWAHGATLISDSYREEYAREYAEQTESIPESILRYVNWEEWADDFYRYDWTDATIELFGAEYTFTVRES